MSFQKPQQVDRQFRNYLALSFFNAFMMMVGGADIVQATYAYPGLLGFLPTSEYVAYGSFYLALGVIYLILDYFALKRNPSGIRASYYYAIVALVMAILWLPAGILSLLASVGALYFGRKATAQ